MKRSLLAGAAVLAMMCSTAALAHVSVGISVGIPGVAYGVPGVVVAPPAYYPPVEYVAPPPPVVVVPRPIYTPVYGWGYYHPGWRHWSGDRHWRGHRGYYDHGHHRH